MHVRGVTSVVACCCLSGAIRIHIRTELLSVEVVGGSVHGLPAVAIVSSRLIVV